MGKTEAIQSAKRFYCGKTCVVTGHAVHNHWHHLDEVHANWVAANIVPAAPNINHSIEQLRKSAAAPLPMQLTPNYLQAAAREHYDLGRFAESYSCSRLGAFVTAKYLSDPDTSVHFATEAMHALRPLADVPCAKPFGVDTLHRSVLPVMRTSRAAAGVRIETEFALCKEIASYCLDHGVIARFERWVKLAAALSNLDSCATATMSHQRLRLAQHVALAELMRGWRGVRPELDRISEEMVGTHRHTFGASTNAQHLALAYTSDRRADEAEDVLRKMECVLGKIEPIDCPGMPTHLGGYSWWTLPRLLLTKADILLIRHRRDDALAHVESALNIITCRRVRALGTVPFQSLLLYRALRPSDPRTPRSQTGGKASIAYFRHADEVLRHLCDKHSLSV